MTHDDAVRVGRYWVWPDGTRLPIISGGDGDDGTDDSTDDGTDDDDDTGEDDEKSERQKEIDRAVQRRLSKERRRLTREMADRLGCSLDEAERRLKAQDADKAKEQSDLDKLKAEAAEAKRERDEAKAEAAKTARRADIREALADAGLKSTKGKKALALILGDLDDDSDDDDITAAVAELKADEPAWFGADDTDTGDGKTKGDKAKRRPPNGGITGKAPAKAGASDAAARIEARHSRLAAMGLKPKTKNPADSA